MATRKCHDGPCGPCSLCKAHNQKYTHPHNFSSEQHTFLCRVEGREVSKTECICYPCSKQIKRNINKEFCPRWHTKGTITQKCSISKCSNEAVKNSHLASRDDIELVLGQSVTTFTVSDKPSVPLCQVHYNEIYHKLRRTSCEACGIKPRRGEHFNRHCPHPAAVNTYLSIVSSEPCLLTDHSVVCGACYKHFKYIVRNIEHGKVATPLLKDSQGKRNADIDSIISAMSSKMTNIYQKRMDALTNDCIEYTVCSVCRRLGEKMKVDEAVLLPTLYKQFSHELTSNLVLFPNARLEEDNIPSTRWLLSQIHECFEGNLEVQCRHKCYGTLVYHKQCDLVHALTVALSRNDNRQQPLPDSATNNDTHTCTCTMPSIEEQMHNVALHLNSKLHERGRSLTASFNERPESIATTDFTSALESTDPQLLSFLSSVTQSVRQTKRRLFSESTPPLNVISPRNIRLFYALCVLQFCTNSTCSAPLHILLTEAVLCHGGTVELIKILNRLGAVASLDTVNRLATHVVQKRVQEGFQSELQPSKFAVVSIDNIDILQPYSFVSSLDLTRSWHGTSVQCVQPHPISGQLTSEDTLDTDSNSSKHVHARSSPIGTPVPVEKHKRRRRTLRENASTSPHSVMVVPELISNTHCTLQYENLTRKLNLEEFKVNAIEQSVLNTLQIDLFHCVLLRKFGSSESGQAFPGLQSFVNCIKQQTTDREVSNITYVEIRSERADSKETLLGIICRLQKVFITELKQKYVLIIGDAKTYNLLQAICHEYKAHLQWLLPFPGDWHILHNYQKVLMKPYADAGLASLGREAGHRAETLTSLLQASNFRRTHEFLLQAYEAIYRYFLSIYISKTMHSDEQEALVDKISCLASKFADMKSESDLSTFREMVSEALTGTTVSYSDFQGFIDQLCRASDTVCFWYRFLCVDCFSYIALFLSLRYRNWELRTGSIKQMAAIFSAFDRPIYQELIPRHVKELLLMPPHVLHHLQRGSFSVRLSKTDWHGVALDECHEMQINKDAKLAVVHPSKHKMEFLSHYMGFRSTCIKNLKTQMFPEQDQNQSLSHSLSNKDKKRETNISSMLQLIKTKDMLSLTKLWNMFEGKEATPEQAHDLLNFRFIGQKAYEQYVTHKIIGLPSTPAPNRKKRLTTFSVTKVQKQRMKLIEKESKISQRYLKMQLAWISKQGTEGLDIDDLLGPVSSVPRALIGKDGLPYKSNKSSTTEYLRKRYSSLPIIQKTLPPQWAPHTAILEGMFLIQSSPLPSMGCMKDYAQWILDQYIKPHFRAGVQEVHVVFDSPGSMSQTPKELEKKRRDKDKVIEAHKCNQLTSSGSLPTKWRSLLECRKCKQNLTVFLAQEMLKLAPNILNRAQAFASNVGETTYHVTSTGEMLPCPKLWSNADEADLRVWLHCIHSPGTEKLVFSPDTDVYHIGLTVLPLRPTTNIVVQLSKSFKEEPKFLFLHQVYNALQNDPDLHGVPQEMRLQALQSLYVCTGCDYVSFFAGIGKVSFLSTFYQYATFIAGGLEAPGSIGDVTLDNESPSCLSFFRLVGCTYYRTHASAFEFASPVTLYHSITASNVHQKHELWLQHIRNTVWLRADSESKNMPSTSSLKLHWMRSLWIIAMWHKSVENDIDMPEMEAFGWTRESGELQVVWESKTSQERAQEKIDYVLKGCKCKKMGCHNKKCKCKKNGHFCGPSCQCINCQNFHGGAKEWDDINQLEVEGQEDIDKWESEEYVEISEDEETDPEMYHDEEVNEIMVSVFGEEEYEDFMT